MTPAEVANRLRARRAGNGKWKARCPAHDDQKPSLSIREGRGGRVLLKCHAGCTIDAILNALRLTMNDISAASPRGESKRRTIVATYDYHDAAGNVVFQVVRYSNPKEFRQRRPDGKGGWVWNLQGVVRVPFNLPALIQANVVLIAEGERDAQSLQEAASSFPDNDGRAIYAATTNAGGAEKWQDEYSPWLRGKKVIVFQDHDDVGRRHALQVCGSTRHYASDVHLLELPGLAEKGDVSDYLASHSPSELFALMNTTPVWNPSAAASGPAISPEKLPEITGSLLTRCCSWIRRFIVLPEEPAIILAAWLLHTHAFDAAEMTPYIHVTSPERECGKSHLMEALAAIAAAPVTSDGITAAALVRTIEACKPTLFLDEMDPQLGADKERAEAIRGILNAGFRRGGVFRKCVGKDFDLKDFNVYSPKCFGGLGRLPDTVSSRSIVVELRRKKKDEIVEHFRQKKVKIETLPIRADLEAWAAAAKDTLENTEPAAIAGLSDRRNDIVEPLLAIAQLAGEDWLRRLTDALVTVFKTGSAEDTSVGVQLLQDIRAIFDERKTDTISSRLLAERLCEIEGRPWAEWSHGKGMTANHLAQQLKKYGISPHGIRFGSETAKGYRRHEFEDPWSRYCSSSLATTVTPSQPASSLTEAANSVRNTEPNVTRTKTAADPREQWGVTAVTVANLGCGNGGLVSATVPDVSRDAEGEDEVRI